MNLTDMTNSANAYTDENFRPSQVLFFVNEAIGTVNAELDCSLPFIDGIADEYTALSETWIRQVLIPYICYSIKMNDSSISEASVFLNSYEKGLERIREKKLSAIPSQYQNNNFENVYQIDYVSGLINTFGFQAKPYYISEYDAYVYYYVGDYVIYQTKTYICIKDSMGNLPTNTTYFREA